jgi:hypothetical protein
MNQGHDRALADAGIDFPVLGGGRASGKPCEVDLGTSQVGNTNLPVICDGSQ